MFEYMMEGIPRQEIKRRKAATELIDGCRVHCEFQVQSACYSAWGDGYVCFRASLLHRMTMKWSAEFNSDDRKRTCFFNSVSW